MNSIKATSNEFFAPNLKGGINLGTNQDFAPAIKGEPAFNSSEFNLYWHPFRVRGFS